MSASVTLNSQGTTSLVGAAIIGGLVGTAGGFSLPSNPAPQTYATLTSYELKLPSHSFTSNYLGFTPKEKIAILRTAQDRIKSTQKELDPEIQKLLNDNLFDLV